MQYLDESLVDLASWPAIGITLVVGGKEFNNLW